MPRKSNVVTVTAWKPLRKGQWYAAKVTGVTLQKASSSLRVTLENLDRAQIDRTHIIDLPLPHPGNRTCVFIRAAGTDEVAVGTTVCLDQLVGRIINMRYRGLECGAERFDFEPAPNPPATAGTDRSSADTGRQLPRPGNVELGNRHDQ
jgi:hypothetical protein